MTRTAPNDWRAGFRLQDDPTFDTETNTAMVDARGNGLLFPIFDEHQAHPHSGHGEQVDDVNLKG